LFKGGYSSLLDIAEAEVEDLAQITGFDESRIKEIMDDAKVLLEEELNGEGPDRGLKKAEDDEQVQSGEKG
jgi:N utilization substance protein A